MVTKSDSIRLPQKTMLQCSVLLSVLCLVLGGPHALPPPRPRLNVLVLSPVSIPSHYNILMPVAAALADKGHNVTMLTNFPVAPSRPSITVVTHGLPHVTMNDKNIFTIGKSAVEVMKVLPVVLWNTSRDMYDTPVVSDLYRRKDEFDVVLIDYFFNEVAYPFAAGKPFITVSLCCNDPLHSMSFGNFLNPSYISHSFDHMTTPFSFVERFINFFVSLTLPMIRYLGTVAPVQYQISKRFPDLPSIDEIEKNQSATFLNSHFSMACPPEPLLPGQVEIGGIHCREGKPLPQDLAEFMSTDLPVVCMSLGTAVSEALLTGSVLKTIVSSFAKLPYRFIWRVNSSLVDAPPNVLLKDWLPQQDLLAQPNLRLFITHAGSLGVQEATYHSTPMLALPVISDQFKNAKRLQNMGHGITISWDDVTEELFTNTIAKLITDPKYQERANSISTLFRDQMNTATERVVFWTEYVVRHKGAPHLRSPQRDSSLIQLLHFDIFSALIVTMWLLYKATKDFRAFLKNGHGKSAASKKKMKTN